MNEQGAPDRPHNNTDDPAPSQEITAAMERFEKAVQDLVSATAGHLGHRATSLIDETSKRLESEARLRRVSDDPHAERRHSRRRRRHRSRHRLARNAERRSRRSSRLVADPGNRKIAGVCGAVARYFGFETWAVRMGALTGLIFLPQIVFPAYWITYFIMDKSSRREREVYGEAKSDGHRRRRRRHRSSRNEEAASMGEQRTRHHAEREEEFVPKRTLRNTTADLTQAELRLRRLESFVTSDQYELHKQLAVIERDGSPQGAA